MHEVTEVNFGVPCNTRVWLSRSAERAIQKFRRKGDPDGSFWKRLKRWAQNGFRLHEGPDGPIRLEWDGVYRVGPIDSLFRIIGFYENDSRAHFIGMDAFLKHGQQLTDGQKKRIDAVAAIKRDGNWRKTENVRYPRIAR
ncbi:MAG TPA: hypothetical protein VGM03_10490 [Phycisphaerae bacterium]|jgi:hypothetical protein